MTPEQKTPDPDARDGQTDTTAFVRPSWAPVRKPTTDEATTRVATGELTRPKTPSH